MQNFDYLYCCSSFKRTFFELSPPRYALFVADLCTTRWQGISTGSGIFFMAVPTARMARGYPAANATCEYEATSPYGIINVARYTSCTNCVPGINIGRVKARRCPLKYSSICVLNSRESSMVSAVLGSASLGKKTRRITPSSYKAVSSPMGVFALHMARVITRKAD